jgi:cytochrome c biogenesis protein CcmG, thiol:disulfide interchange protein DsbE
MRRIAAPAVVSLLAVALVALLVFGVLQTGDSTSLDQAVAKGARPAAPSRPLPQLDGPGTRAVAGYRGHYLVVNFFASWCTPCAEEAPLLNGIQRTLAKRGGTVLGVAWDDTIADARKFARDNRLSFPLVRDVDGAFGRAYAITGMPETFVVDPQGRIVALRRAQLTHAWVSQTLDPLIGRSRSS